VLSGTVLVARGSEVLFEYACGAANKRYDVPNNPDTKFNLGSANKMFTAVAVAQLVERGLLGFTDTVDQYIDDTWLPASVTRRITIHHLLSHTSGLGNYSTRHSSAAHVPGFVPSTTSSRSCAMTSPPLRRVNDSNTAIAECC